MRISLIGVQIRLNRLLRGGMVSYDLRDLRLFVAVAEERSITHAAQRTHMTLAAASARIRALERKLNVQLFARNARGVTLTRAGDVVLSHARLMLRESEYMRLRVAHLAVSEDVHLHIMCNTAAVTEVLADALPGFLKAQPNVSVDIQEEPSTGIAKAIRDGTAQLGIAADTAELSGLETVPLCRDTLVAVAAQSHSLAQRRAVRFAEVVKHPFISLPSERALHSHLAANASASGQELRLRVQLPTFEAIGQTVEAKAGVTVMPMSAALRISRLYRLRRIPLVDAWANRTLVACTRDFSALSAPAQQLIRALKERAAPRHGSAAN